MEFEILKLILCGELPKQELEAFKTKWNYYCRSFNEFAERLEQSDIEVSELQNLLNVYSDLTKVVCKKG